MSDLFWLTPSQLKHIEPHFPLSHGIPRVDDLRVLSGILHVIPQRPVLARRAEGLRAAQDLV